MKKALFAAFAALLALTAWADTEIVQSGYFEVHAGDEVVSQHATYRKALQAAINHDALELTITAPTVTVTKDARDIDLSWDRPTERENGAALPEEEIDGYWVHLAREGEPEVERWTEATGVTVRIPGGLWTLSVSAVDTDGLESRRSESKTIDELGRLVASSE